MNRNMRRGRGSGAGIQRGPLAANHIRNLDEELEILQRRRDLLQREQALLVNEQMFGRKRQYENDQYSQNFIPFNQQAAQSFSHLYDDGPGPNLNHGGGSKKRHTVNVWDNDMLNTNLNSNNQRFRPYMGPKPQSVSAPKPLMSIMPKPSIGHRIPGFPQNVRKNFNPTKVTKPKGKPQNKAKPNPVSKASLKKALVSSPEKPKEPQILRADQVPSKQMTGRLELALGAILKEMRQSFCTTEECTLLFNAKHIQRVIKNLIRKRLRNLMLNKVVGRFADIVALYRENFPQKTDKEIFDSAVLTSGSNEKYMRYSVNRLMTKKLDEMFMKLQEFYEGDEGIAKIIESRPSSVMEIPKDKDKDEATMTIERQFYDTLVDTLLEVKLPKVLPNYTDKIIKLLENDEEIKKAKQLAKKANQNANEESATIEINDSETENDEVEDQPTQYPDNTDVEGQSKESSSATEQTNNGEGTQIDETKNDNVVEKGMENDGVETNTAKTGANVPTEPMSITSQYFVKVFGQPILPNRADAYKFLNQFNAVSIKKHKVVQNLLVVGFKNEKDFENAIANSGAVVGSSKLIIKANENQEQNTSSPSPKDDDACKNTSISKDIITPDLENQISDLLSSIRKADEEQKSDDDIKTEDISQETNDIKQVKKGTQGTKVYSPSNMYDEDSQGLGTIQEDAENKIIEGNKATSENASEDQETQDNGRDKETKNKETGKGTPMKATSRLSNVTPSTIRTRRASRLALNN